MIPNTSPLSGTARFPRLFGRLLPGSDRLLVAILILISAAATLAYLWLWSPLTLSADEAHYWDWSRNLDWSYYSKGPLVAYLIRGSCELFGPLSVQLTGDLAAAVRLPAVGCHVVMLTGWYVLASSVLRSTRAGLAITAIAAALPLVRVGAVLMTIDPPFLACWCWALVCVWKGLETSRLRWWFGAAVLTAVGILAKYTMVLLPAALVGFLLFHRRAEFRRAGIWILLAGGMVGWLPVVVWNAQHEWVSFRHVFGQVGGEQPGRGFRLLGPIAFAGGQFGVMFGFWLAAFLIAGWRYRPTHETDPGVRLLWWCSVPVWCFFAAASCVKSGQPNWPAPAYVAGLVLAVAWVRERILAGTRGLQWLVGGFVGLGLLASLAVYFPPPLRPTLARLAGSPTPEEPAPVRRLDVTVRLAGWKQLAAEVDRTRARVLAETGCEPILAGTHWTLPGIVRFYCAGHPDVYSIGRGNQSDRYSQYDLWRPNPVADAQVFRGRTFVIVGDVGPATLAAFERVELPTRVVATENGVPVASWAVIVCHGFRGYDPTAATATPRY